ncbi:uncharacterized protein G2W53_000829 [Senna tora]|uniref:Uncharacterized protein n=1 Tax=Senna tora TaxID=362788 RepID=A0A834XEQ9_9FABA|nr:uncharacterized protein G2W53_000829 [Senna tora]
MLFASARHELAAASTCTRSKLATTLCTIITNEIAWMNMILFGGIIYDKGVGCIKTILRICGLHESASNGGRSSNNICLTMKVMLAVSHTSEITGAGTMEMTDTFKFAIT